MRGSSCSGSRTGASASGASRTPTIASDMCGISGAFHCRGDALPESPSLKSAILFRGRDSQGSWGAPGVALHQARLAIIDPQGGEQPMTDASGRYTLVYSGEVYNYRELRAEYERLGAQFRTRSDTEVV